MDELLASVQSDQFWMGRYDREIFDTVMFIMYKLSILLLIVLEMYLPLFFYKGNFADSNGFFFKLLFAIC